MHYKTRAIRRSTVRHAQGAIQVHYKKARTPKLQMFKLSNLKASCTKRSMEAASCHCAVPRMMATSRGDADAAQPWAALRHHGQNSHAGTIQPLRKPQDAAHTLRTARMRRNQSLLDAPWGVHLVDSRNRSRYRLKGDPIKSD